MAGARTIGRIDLLVLLALVLGGCALQVISPYDARTEERIFASARAVELFYDDLLERPEGQRPYADFRLQYREIEGDLRNLVLRNRVRSLNEDSTRISGKLLSQWQACKERHRSTDSYRRAVAELDRDRFRRLFEYAARAEGAKPPLE